MTKGGKTSKKNVKEVSQWVLVAPGRWNIFFLTLIDLLSLYSGLSQGSSAFILFSQKTF